LYFKVVLCDKCKHQINVLTYGSNVVPMASFNPVCFHTTKRSDEAVLEKLTDDNITNPYRPTTDTPPTLKTQISTMLEK